jgi:hypothetical protein
VVIVDFWVVTDRKRREWSTIDRVLGGQCKDFRFELAR